MTHFRALAALLAYPERELIEALPELRAALRRDVNLWRFLEELEGEELRVLQERYGALFDRSRALSLHLFEHVHGEGRDRGQAMIDLKNLYEKNGLLIGTAELPDFLPLFLEYLSTRPLAEACDLLGQPAHILSALAERLRRRSSPYEAVFRALVALAASKPKGEDVSALLQAPDPEATDLAALDAAWEDEPVRFGPGATDGCKDGLIARVRAGRRPAPGMPVAPASHPVLPRS
jgi:nitrate reductase molybdenum cofactor assembly chaperone NarJ/NarW